MVSKEDEKKSNSKTDQDNNPTQSKPSATPSFLLRGATSSMERERLGSPWFFWRRRRVLIAVLAFLGFTNLYTARVNLSVAIVFMTTPNNVTDSSGRRHLQPPDFAWDSRTQGWLLSSFFYGYLVSQVPSGFLAYIVGGTRLFGISIGISSILSLFTPLAAHLGFYALLMLRVLLGVFGGMSLPAINTVWMRWAPPAERCRLATIAASGVNVGTVLVFFVSGLLEELWGWQAIFYVFGPAASAGTFPGTVVFKVWYAYHYRASLNYSHDYYTGVLGVVWFCFWLMVVFEGPELDPMTAPEELMYIRAGLGSFSRAHDPVVYPWRKIVTNTPFLALACAHFANNWGFYTFLTQLPSYLNDTRKLKVNHMGMLAALPYILLGALMQVSGQVADRLIKKKILSTTHTRKLLLSGTMVVQSILLLIMIRMTTNMGLMITVMLVIAITAFPKATILVNHLDLAPKHGGVLMGVTNSLATLPGIISPVLTGYIVQNKSAQEWQDVFYVMVVLYLVGAVIYFSFASGERQDWAKEANAAPPRVIPSP